MSLLADLRERFTKAQERREELVQTLEERREAQAKAAAIELQIEAEELAERVPSLMLELQQIMGELMPLYFQFEMSARQHLTRALFSAPANAYRHQASVLKAIYVKNEARDFSIHTGERTGSRKFTSGTEGVDTRYSDSYDPVAQAAELRAKGPDFRHQAYALERMAEEQARQAKLAAMRAPEWLPRLPVSQYADASNASILDRAWGAEIHE